MTRVIELTVWLALFASAPALAQGRPQTPPPPPPGVPAQPVGRGADKPPAPTGAPASQVPRPQPPVAPASRAARPTVQSPAPGRTAAPATASILPVETAPTEAQLGLPLYPGASFIRSFDAGQGQRYFLFGSTASFADLVQYYRTQLKEKGDLVYDEPPVHMFEVGRFREETMAFPPGVTVKDYTWGGGKGYLVPTPGAGPSRFPTVIQIVPVAASNR